MKKIVLPFEGDNYPESALDLVRRINIGTPVVLTTVFVPEVDYAQLWTASAGVMANTYVPTVDEDLVVRKNSARVQEFCVEHGIQLVLHTDRFDFALAAIRKESRFADLLLISSQHFFDTITDKQPNVYMKEMLNTAECPVLMASENCGLPGEIILAYDGSPASVHAIRQFSYLFEDLCDTPTALVYLADK